METRLVLAFVMSVLWLFYIPLVVGHRKSWFGRFLLITILVLASVATIATLAVTSETWATDAANVMLVVIQLLMALGGAIVLAYYALRAPRSSIRWSE